MFNYYQAKKEDHKTQSQQKQRQQKSRAKVSLQARNDELNKGYRRRVGSFIRRMMSETDMSTAEDSSRSKTAFKPDRRKGYDHAPYADGFGASMARGGTSALKRHDSHRLYPEQPEIR